jgi:perosamine synthetase
MIQSRIYLDDPNLGALEKEYLIQCLDSTYISTYGPYVPKFEEKFANVLDSNSAVALQSGTAGLHMALYELGLGEGDEVIVPALTFVATANAVKYVGAKPVFVDVDPLTWNMDPDRLKEAISEKTKAIIAVHLFGNPCAMEEIVSIANQHQLYLVEDATESLGAKYKGKYTGTLGDFGVFSFNGNKVITTGSGGMMIGSDEDRVKHVRFLVNQARDEQKGYFHPEIGFNYRMTNMEAALGLAQLKRLDEFIQKKKLFYEIYSQAFDGISDLRLQQSYAGSDSVWWLSSVTIDTEKVGLKISKIQMKLKESGVPTRRIFMPIVGFPPYFDDDSGKFTETYRIYENGLNLPSSTLNRRSDIETVADTVIRIIKKHK